MWYEIIFPVIVGVVGMMLGIKIGFEDLARDLYHQYRIKPEEFEYIASGEYFWKRLNPFSNDRQ